MAIALKQQDKWAGHDPDLFAGLHNFLDLKEWRRVSMIEQTGLIPRAEYYGAHVPDSTKDRNDWFDSLSERAKGHDLVFLDPDNGLEVKSRPYGRKNSSKYLYWREIKALWGMGKSLLIYQHFIRQKRPPFIESRLKSLEDAAPGSCVVAFSTAHVVFLMALQPKHTPKCAGIIDLVQRHWAGQIKIWAPIPAQTASAADC